MPELPEVETTRRGIRPHCLDQQVSAVIVRQPRLRWPVPRELPQLLRGHTIRSVERRAKYLLLGFDHGSLILHLGMSGSLRLVEAGQSAGKHDHLDLVLGSGQALRLCDPRRFGAVLWNEGPVLAHERLRDLGPEPLSEAFDGEHLYRRSRARRAAVKPFIMDGRIVVGVGNIYACEALFLAAINPRSAAGSISRARYGRLAEAIKAVLNAAIAQGGTTLRDFVGGDGRPGYFAQSLQVYGRAGEPCTRCARPVKHIRQGQRSTFYCSHCQR